MNTAQYVFLSYSSKDADVAAEIYTFLTENRIRCWFAPRDMKAGKNYPSQIVAAIKDCDAFVLVSTEHSNFSAHVENEVSIAFDQRKQIIVFCARDAAFSDGMIYYLNRTHHIRTGGDMPAGLAQLKSALLPLQQPAPPPGKTPPQNTSAGSDNAKVDIADLFESFFGKDSADTAPKKIPKGMVRCPACTGTGRVTAVQNSPFGKMQTRVACEKCRGKGYIKPAKK